MKRYTVADWVGWSTRDQRYMFFTRRTVEVLDEQTGRWKRCYHMLETRRLYVYEGLRTPAVRVSGEVSGRSPCHTRHGRVLRGAGKRWSIIGTYGYMRSLGLDAGARTRLRKADLEGGRGC